MRWKPKRRRVRSFKPRRKRFMSRRHNRSLKLRVGHRL